MGCKGGKVGKQKLDINWKLESKSERQAQSWLKKNKVVKRK